MISRKIGGTPRWGHSVPHPAAGGAMLTLPAGALFSGLSVGKLPPLRCG